MALSPLHLTFRLGQRRTRRCQFRVQTLIPIAIDGSCANAAGRATARGPSSEKRRCGIGKPRRTWTLSCPRPMRLVMLTRSQLRETRRDPGGFLPAGITTLAFLEG